MTEEFLENFFDLVIIQGIQLNKWLQDITSKYLVSARCTFRKLTPQQYAPSKLNVKASTETFYKARTFKGIVSMFGYGYIDPQNRKIQTIIAETFQHILCGDASHAIMNLLGKQEGLKFLFISFR